METIFIQLAVILCVAFIVSYIVRVFRQPIIIGYIIAGILISPFILDLGASQEIIQIFSDFGIAFLLFIVGLHLNPKVIKEVGAPSFLIGLSQIVVTFGIGFAVSTFILGFNSITSAYIGIALAFSSTIIIMKLLSDRGQLNSLYGKMSTGILIIQDLVAIAFLIFISSSIGNLNLESFVLKSLISGLGLIVFVLLVGFFILPKLTRIIAKSQELLFLFSITWCFLIAGLFSYLGFSIEIGALVAGVVLSMSPYSTEISSKIRPLRDFFLIIFFIILGINVQVSNMGPIIFTAFILSLIALILKPIILMILTGFFGYTKRTNFFVGITLAQISEFSLIVLGLGVAVNHISSEILQAMTLAMIFTIIISTYFIMYSQGFYKKMSWLASLFEKKRARETHKTKKQYNAILFGYNRIGFSILNSLKKIKKNYLVIDFNPDIISDLQKMRIPCLYGDAYDLELLDDLPLQKSELIISTIPDKETNILLIERIREVNPKAILIVRAHSIEEAFEFYEKGASYVLTPHFLGGEYVAKMIRTLKSNSESYKLEKNKHMKLLKDRFKKGYKHPDIERN